MKREFAIYFKAIYFMFVNFGPFFVKLFPGRWGREQRSIYFLGRGWRRHNGRAARGAQSNSRAVLGADTTTSCVSFARRTIYFQDFGWRGRAL